MMSEQTVRAFDVECAQDVNKNSSSVSSSSERVNKALQRRENTSEVQRQLEICSFRIRYSSSRTIAHAVLVGKFVDLTKRALRTVLANRNPFCSRSSVIVKSINNVTSMFIEVAGNCKISVIVSQLNSESQPSRRL